MCIAFFTSKHPDYALILVDNRDEYILRPTSRPHWWTHPATGRHVLSARDLERPERGTWLGVTPAGRVCVLTNYREPARSPVAGRVSRGAMVTNWLGQETSDHDDDGSIAGDVGAFLADTDVRGSGGFSMLVGKLSRKKGTNGENGEDGERKGEGESKGQVRGEFAIVSNRAGSLEDVPLLNLDERDGGWGLTNTAFDRSAEWEKVVLGTAAFDRAVRTHGEQEASSRTEDELIERLLKLLSANTLADPGGKSLAETLQMLKGSVFIPPLGDERHRAEMEAARARGKGEWWSEEAEKREKESGGVNGVNGDDGGKRLHPHGEEGFTTGLYGTQRQTVLLVGRDSGEVTFFERALWDPNGNEIPRGQGDVVHRFKIGEEE
ncbi:hypothetical protein N3K66_004750 [Trichothecium roseum]|uniref:Uncharacterized protein n=1 Tax=Trichothecium roseum TaxID=47278 RepID=A0ACC0V236_9HYPO|nr:hypothetical protein N3K66_004750 [Trichothecium roseum]